MYKTRNLTTLIVLLLPLLVLGGWVAMLWQDSRHAPTYHVMLTGYDPRDLVHGRYLNLAYDWDHAETEKPAETSDLPRRARFYIPESDADTLDRMVRNRANQFSAIVTIRNKRVAIKTLLIDGKPWQDALAVYTGTVKNP